MMLRTFALALAIAALATPALAEDFTFIVPVDVRNLPPEVTQMDVTCATAVLPGGASRARMVGSGRARVAVSGSYSGDVTISFNATRAGDAAAADGYTCTITSFSTPFVPGVGGRTFSTSDRELMFPLNPTATYRPFVADVRLP